MMASFRMRFLVVAGAIALAGCGSGSASSGDGGTVGPNGSSGGTDVDGGPAEDSGPFSEVDANVACTRYVDATTTRLDTCYPRAFNSTFVERNLGPALAKVRCLASLSGEGARVRPNQFAACADALMALSCPAYLDQFTRPYTAPAACSFPHGTRAVGSPCATDSQCTGRCKIDKNFYIEDVVKTCGVCVDELTEGSPCKPQAAPSGCAPGLGCGSDATCAKILPAGELGASCPPNDGLPCRTSLQCDYLTKTCKPWPKDGTQCENSSGCGREQICEAATGTCQPRPVAGETCRSSGTAERSCAAAFYCNPSQKCAPRIHVGAGEACDQGRSCKDGECGTGSKVCPSVVGKGQACKGLTGSDCMMPLLCLEDSCVDVTVPSCK